jgi:hypothetical protein
MKNWENMKLFVFVNVEIDPSRLWNCIFGPLKTSLKKEVEEERRKGPPAKQLKLSV